MAEIFPAFKDTLPVEQKTDKLPSFEETEELPSFNETEEIKLGLPERFKAGDPAVSFEPDIVTAQKEEAASFGFQTKAALARTGNIAGFTIPQKLSAVVESTIDLAFSDKSLLDDRDLKTRFKQTYKEIIQRGDENLDRAFEANLLTQGIATGVGYYLNPAARALRGSKLALKLGESIFGTATVVGLEVAAVEGGEASINTLSRVATGEKLGAAALDEFKEAGLETLIGFAAGGALKFSTAPVKAVAAGVGKTLKTVIEPIANLRKGNLNKEARVLIDNYKKATSTPNKARAEQTLEKAQQDVSQAYKDLQDVVAIDVETIAADVRPSVATYQANLKNVVNIQARDMVEAMAKKTPEGVQKNLSKTAKIVDKLHNTAQHNYGVELDEIATFTKGKTINLKDSINSFYTALADTGDAILVDGGILLDKVTKQQLKKVVTFINGDLAKTGQVTWRQAAELKQVLGKLVKWGRNVELDEGEQALKQLWFDIAETLDNPEILGKAAGRYKLLKNSYREVMEISGDAARASRSLSRFGNYEDTAFLKRLNNSMRQLEELDRISTTLAKNKKPIAAFPKEDVQFIKKTLQDTRRLHDINRVGKHNKAVSTLKKLAKEGTDVTDDNIEAIRRLVETVESVDAVKVAAKEFDISKVIMDVVDDPFNKPKLTKARQYIKDYAGPAKGDLEQLLNRAAQYDRLGGTLPNVNHRNIINLVESGNIAAPGEVKAMRLGMKMDSRIGDILADADFARAFIKENPSVIRTITKPGLQGTEVGIGAISLAGEPFLAATAGVLLALWRTIQNPTALLLLSERLVQKQAMNPKLAQELSRIARWSAGTITALSRQEGQDADQGQPNVEVSLQEQSPPESQKLHQQLNP